MGEFVIRLPDQQEKELAAEAERLGISVEEYAAELLSVARELRSTPHTGAELVAYWQREGLVGSRSENTDASAHARVLREQSQQRARR